MPQRVCSTDFNTCSSEQFRKAKPQGFTAYRFAVVVHNIPIIAIGLILLHFFDNLNCILAQSNRCSAAFRFWSAVCLLTSSSCLTAGISLFDISSTFCNRKDIAITYLQRCPRKMFTSTRQQTSSQNLTTYLIPSIIIKNTKPKEHIGRKPMCSFICRQKNVRANNEKCRKNVKRIY